MALVALAVCDRKGETGKHGLEINECLCVCWGIIGTSS